MLETLYDNRFPVMNNGSINLPVGNLTHLGFQAVYPHPRLRPWLQCYWSIRTLGLPQTGVVEKLYPDGGSSLIFSFRHRQQPQLSFRACHNMALMPLSDGEDLLGIRFHPGGAFQLLGKQLPTEIDIMPEPELLVPPLRQLCQQLDGIDSFIIRIQLIENWLLQSAEQADYGVIQHLLPQLLQSPLTIEQLSSQAAISRRQLERTFRQEVGLPAIHLKTLHRIRQARMLINLNPQRSLTEIALSSGFYDQAQFIHQFKKITHQTPGQYRQRKQSKTPD